MDRLLLCNDLINNALDRFEACKKGDWVAARAVVEQANPTSTHNDLISFDAFADDNDDSVAAAGGGLALPTGNAAAPSTSNPGFTAGGLPLDLFAPSPSGSPAPPAAGPSSRMDPMALFNTAPSQPSFFAPQGQQQQAQQASPFGQSSPFGQASPAAQASPSFNQQASPSYGQPLQQQQPAQAMGQFDGLFSTQPAQQQQQQPPQFNFAGLSPAPSNGHSGSPAPAQQPAKKDAFADLVDLMG